MEAPEGTALPDLDWDRDEAVYQLFGPEAADRLTLEPAQGAYPADAFGYQLNFRPLPDSEPNDNRKEFVLCFTMGHGDASGVKFNDGGSKILTIPGLWVQDAQKGYTPVFTGEFRFDIGLNFQSQRVELDAKGVSWTDPVLDYTNTLEYLALSPLSLSFRYRTTLPENKYFGPDVSIAVVLKDGTQFVPVYDTTQNLVDYLKGYHDLEPEDILPLSGEPGQDNQGYIAFDQPLDLSQVDCVLFGDVKIPVGAE